MTDTPKDPAETPEPTPQEQGSQDSVADTPRTDEHDATLPRAEFDAIRRDHDTQTSAPTQSADAHSAADQGEASAATHGQTDQQPTAEQPTAQQPAAGAAANQTQPTEPLPPQAVAAAAASQAIPTQPDAQGPQGQGAQNPYAAQQGGYHYGQQYAQQGNYQYGAQQGAFGQPTYAGQPPYAPGQPGQPQKPAKQKDGKGNRAGLLITGFVLAGLLGGGVGAGVVGIYAANSGNSKAVTSTGATSVTVNDPQTATDVTAVASKVSPSVVTINVTGSQEAGTGSGVVLSSDGYVLTNTHVVTLDGETGSASITVTTNDGKIYKAKVVGTDPVLDLAVIQIQNVSGLTPATFADSDKVNVGDQTIAIGAPLGLSGTVTDGIVSALNRSIQIASSAAPSQDQQDNGNGSGNGDNSPFNFWNFDQNGGSSGQSSTQSTISLPVIQTDAAINPGNSGGPLLNAKGQVTGINVAIASAGSSSSSTDQTGSIGVGFAIPSNVAQRVGDEIIKNGKATSGLLGATVADSTSDSNATTVGALIKSVTSGGAAAGAGLQAGDIVTNFNGKPITNATDLTAQVRALAGGSKATIEYQRNGQTKQSDVTLGTLSS
ncbi:PDZ domain-containing protein [Planctomonas sp. JC2975]|uniref:S1C family serine protease n=1 Tax=Planctomonas sp. JC2975 TaxID=2729626 RepID=UPI0014731950|nr:trypsin-like peptidase domain-containing protein [Planctomonas sp. JC2975]NNC11140.1 PDZ domain-containing protein [Planctomonas sp. JC2975]